MYRNDTSINFNSKVHYSLTPSIGLDFTLIMLAFFKFIIDFFLLLFFIYM